MANNAFWLAVQTKGDLIVLQMGREGEACTAIRGKELRSAG